MLSDALFRKKILTNIWDNGRKLDYYLLLSFIEDTDEEIIFELQKYQNDDGGFGHALEPDIRMPFSSVAATNIAVYALDYVKSIDVKEDMLQEIVAYFESCYDTDKKAWSLVPAVVNEYPRAVWWNYENVDTFTYGNPNPQVIGFLYQNRKYLKKIDILSQLNKVVDYVNGPFMKEATMHSILSVLEFYKRVDKDVKNLIKAKLQAVIDIELEKTKDLTNEYVLEPYLVALTDKMLLSNHLELLEENLQSNYEKLQLGCITPKWQWYQFDEVFEDVKDEWNGFLTLKVVQALRLHSNCQDRDF